MTGTPVDLKKVGEDLVAFMKENGWDEPFSGEDPSDFPIGDVRKFFAQYQPDQPQEKPKLKGIVGEMLMRLSDRPDDAWGKLLDQLKEVE